RRERALEFFSGALRPHARLLHEQRREYESSERRPAIEQLPYRALVGPHDRVDGGVDTGLRVPLVRAGRVLDLPDVERRRPLDDHPRFAARYGTQLAALVVAVDEVAHALDREPVRLEILGRRVLREHDAARGSAASHLLERRADLDGEQG